MEVSDAIMRGLALWIGLFGGPSGNPALPDIADAYEFSVSSKTAHEMWQLAYYHKEKLDKSLNNWANATQNFLWYQQWSTATDRSVAAWMHLTSALGGWWQTKIEDRQESLKNLKLHLGDEDYRLRKMPLPAPGHLFEPYPPVWQPKR